MNFFDYIIGITVGSLAANSILNIEKSVFISLISVVVLALSQIVISFFTLKNKALRKFFEGQATLLIDQGKIVEKNLFITRLNIDRLEALLRDKGVFKLDDVEYAYLETTGKVSVLKKSSVLPVSPKDINLSVKGSGVGTLVIEEGKILDKELRQLGYTFSWLQNQLKANNIQDVSEVMFGQVDKNGKLYIDVYEKNDKSKKTGSK